MMTYRFPNFFLTTVLALLFSLAAPAQAGYLQVFIDCSSCDMGYLRQELRYVDHVRDQALAEVSVLINRQGNAGGGDSYELQYAGKKRFRETTFVLDFMVPPTATNYEVREALRQRLEQGLLPFLLQTDLSHRMDINIDPSAVVASDSLNSSSDPWRNWVFELYGEGNLARESSRSSLDLETGAEIDRVTEDWRVRIDLELNFSENRFLSKEERFVSRRQHHYATGSLVRSLGPHWSAGLFGGVHHNTYSNLALAYDLRPAVEYNLFPYREVLRRELTLAYKIGYLHNRYIEPTIYNRLAERLFHHSLDFEVRFRQAWGDISSSLEVSTFLHDFSKNRLELDSYIAIRLFKGLAVRVSTELQLIRDQITLPAGDASLEDILLRQRQIATNFEMEVGIGLSYVFGSTYNNIVNTRL